MEPASEVNIASRVGPASRRRPGRSAPDPPSGRPPTQADACWPPSDRFFQGETSMIGKTQILIGLSVLVAGLLATRYGSAAFRSLEAGEVVWEVNARQGIRRPPTGRRQARLRHPRRPHPQGVQGGAHRRGGQPRFLRARVPRGPGPPGEDQDLLRLLPLGQPELQGGGDNEAIGLQGNLAPQGRPARLEEKRAAAGEVDRPAAAPPARPTRSSYR